MFKLFPALWSVRAPADSPPRQPWTAEIGPRLHRYFLLKLIGTTALACLFMCGYFLVLHHPAYAVIVMPLTSVDPMIPFQPHWLFVYLSLWLYVGVGPGLQLTLTELAVYTVWLGALCLAGLVTFYLWPTQVPPNTLYTSDFPGIAMLRRVDAAGNACPSLHVAAAMFTAIRVEDVLRWARTPLMLRLLNLAWFAAIAYSTLAVKQHVVIDVLVGALFGVVFALPSLRWRPRRAVGIAAS